MSTDAGGTWHLIKQLPVDAPGSDCEDVLISLAEFANSTSTILIKFQQFDNSPAPADGFTLEYVAVEMGCEVNADCNDGIACTVDLCNPQMSACDHTPDNSCDDGAFCNGVERCDAVLGCQLGIVPDCSDGVVCTFDECLERPGGYACISKPHDQNCDDQNFCNGVETCDPVAGCVSGKPVNCDDGIDCTTDTCVDTETCAHTPGDSACSDGQFCNGAEICHRNGCQPGAPPTCNDAIPCTADSCDPVSNACKYEPNDSQCDDGLFCNGAETCDPVLGCQPGAPPDCDDGVACTTETCDEANDQCVHIPQPEECDDGVFCNGPETCDPVQGCMDGPDPCLPGQVCDEPNLSCQECVAEGDCIDDGIFCNGRESCQANQCVHLDPPDCADTNPCTVDRCDGVTDICVNEPNDVLCSDGQFCNGLETCNPQTGCVPGTPVNCDDGIFCNGFEVCEPTHGCLAGPKCPFECTCDEENDACLCGCPHNPCPDPQECEDVDCVGDSCVYSERSTGEPCGDDGIACTLDLCDGFGRCEHAPDHSSCDDGLYCNGVEVCDPLGGCQGATNPCSSAICDEQTDRCVECLIDGHCDDGNPCTTEFCEQGICAIWPDCATVADCNDGDLCTFDLCANLCCIHTPSICAEIPCKRIVVCDPLSGCQHVDDCRNGPLGTCCPDDGNPCTQTMCDPATGICGSQPDCAIDADCSDQNVCTTDTCENSCCVHTSILCPVLTCGENTGCDAISGCTYLEIHPCCGDGIVEDDETCDPPGSILPDGSVCGDVCKRCGDGVLGEGEECEVGIACLGLARPCSDIVCDPQQCRCVKVNKPDGAIVHWPEFDFCLDFLCHGGIAFNHPKPSGVACGNAAPQGVCDTPDSCDGFGTCGSNYKDAGTICRPAIDVCDVPEPCSGLSAACPPDTFAASGTLAQSDGEECTYDVCDGHGLSVHPPKARGMPCGDPLESTCNLPDTCDGAGRCDPNFLDFGNDCHLTRIANLVACMWGPSVPYQGPSCNHADIDQDADVDLQDLSEFGAGPGCDIDSCNDGDPCTRDFCDYQTGVCSYVLESPLPTGCEEIVFRWVGPASGGRWSNRQNWDRLEVPGFPPFTILVRAVIDGAETAVELDVPVQLLQLQISEGVILNATIDDLPSNEGLLSAEILNEGEIRRGEGFLRDLEIASQLIRGAGMIHSQGNAGIRLSGLGDINSRIEGITLLSTGEGSLKLQPDVTIQNVKISRSEVDGSGTVELYDPQDMIWEGSVENNGFVTVLGEATRINFSNGLEPYQTITLGGTGTISADTSFGDLTIAGAPAFAEALNFDARNGGSLKLTSSISGGSNFRALGGTLEIGSDMGQLKLSGERLDVSRGNFGTSGFVSIDQGTTLDVSHFSIGPGGTFESSATTLLGREPTIIAGSVVDHPDGALLLDGSTVLHVKNDLVLDGMQALAGPCNHNESLEGTVSGGPTPPIKGIKGAAQLYVDGNIEYLGNVTVACSSSEPVVLHGNFRNYSRPTSCFDYTTGAILLSSASLSQLGMPLTRQDFEVAGLDLGNKPEGFINNFAIGSLTVAPNTIVRFLDSFENQASRGLSGDVNNDAIEDLSDHAFFISCLSLSGPGRQLTSSRCGPFFDFDIDGDIDLRDVYWFQQRFCASEALYVRTLVLEENSIVEIDNCHVYYDGLVDLGATLTILGCGQLKQTLPTAISIYPPKGAVDAGSPKPH